MSAGRDHMPPAINANIELLVLPYESAEGNSLLHRLITELASGHWTRFWCAIAFGRQSGNFPDLLGGLAAFVQGGGEASMTFGADMFSGRAKGTDYEAVEDLLRVLQASGGFKLHLYHERGRTFHPKVYLFDNLATESSVVVIGSSNWSDGGLVSNVEANVVVHLDLSQAEHRDFHEAIVAMFTSYWMEA